MTDTPQEPGFAGSDVPPPPPPAPAYGMPAAGPNAYAHWGSRVGAYLIDVLVTLPGLILVWIGAAQMSSSLSTDPTAPAPSMPITYWLGLLLMLAISVWNLGLRQGATGQSIGKKVIGIKLIGEATGQPIGAGMSIARMFVHIIDGLPCYIGYLWPLWDAKRQTFADKILSTVVVPAPKS